MKSKPSFKEANAEYNAAALRLGEKRLIQVALRILETESKNLKLAEKEDEKEKQDRAKGGKRKASESTEAMNRKKSGLGPNSRSAK